MRPTSTTASLMAGLAVSAGVVGWWRGAPARAVRRAFAAWGAGTGSIYDLMDAETEIVIPGIQPHCGTYRKEAFLRDVASPFGARFATPPVPRLRTLWASGGTIAAMADSGGVTRDGRSYANAYVLIFEMTGSRVTKVTEFLDMAAFNAVWDGVEPAPGQREHRQADDAAAHSAAPAAGEGQC